MYFCAYHDNSPNSKEVHVCVVGEDQLAKWIDWVWEQLLEAYEESPSCNISFKSHGSPSTVHGITCPSWACTTNNNANDVRHEEAFKKKIHDSASEHITVEDPNHIFVCNVRPAVTTYT